MRITEKIKPYQRIFKIASLISGTGFFITYHAYRTYKHLEQIINPNVLDHEKKVNPEYIYIEDPAYGLTVEKERVKESQQSVGFARIWKSLKHSLAWRLLWLCRHGSREQRNVALEQLAAFRSNKDWDCLKLAQAMDMHTAVLLARTREADLRYFLPPPVHVRRAAAARELLSFKLRDMILAAHTIHPHTCIQHFLAKHFANIQESELETDLILAKPDSISERDLCILCLDALHHHINFFYEKKYEEDQSTMTLIKMGLLPRIAELLLRYPNDPDIDSAVLKILKVLSIHQNLLGEFFQNGLIGQLSRLVKSKDIRLSSSSAVCLVNLSGESHFGPGLYLLHPIYRTTAHHRCDTLLVHGLRGGVFVTWRQRDRKCAEPLGLLDGTLSDIENCDPCEVNADPTSSLSDPELRQVIQDLMELEDESLLADLEVVLQDLPIKALREPASSQLTAVKKRIALIEEEQDRCNYTFCWPKDWLPKDCADLRIIGVNYWSSLSEWLERCPLQTADIAKRASELTPALVDAGVGRENLPVVWLAHSMGGLIVKQVLVEAAKSEDSEFKKICENTKALIFYSTPHRGSSLAKMPRAAAAVLWPSNDVRQLQEGSPVLLELHRIFNELADAYKWETISFAETKPTLVTAFKVPVHFVETVSADPGRGVFYEMPLDHLSICKPATRQSILYTSTLDVLQRVTRREPARLLHGKSHLQWLASALWLDLRSTAHDVLEKMDETQRSERTECSERDTLNWFERFLLNVFTDGFTD